MKKPDPRDHPCDLCGDPHAPYGFERAGGRAARRPGQRRLWACKKCRAAAEARKEAVDRPLSDFQQINTRDV